jgi:hypothetical protein
MAGLRPHDSIVATSSGAIAAARNGLAVVPGTIVADVAGSGLAIGLIAGLVLLAYWYRRIL